MSSVLNPLTLDPCAEGQEQVATLQICIVVCSYVRFTKNVCFCLSLCLEIVQMRVRFDTACVIYLPYLVNLGKTIVLIKC